MWLTVVGPFLLVECPCVVLLTFCKNPGGCTPRRVDACVGCVGCMNLLWLSKRIIVGALLGVWGSTWCLHCLRVLMRVVWVVVPGWLTVLLAGRCGWLVVVGVVCENCIVDASILFFVCVCFLIVCVLGYSCVCLLFKGAWWMPWHAEPMKDV